MIEIILGITIFVSLPTAYIISTENSKIRSIFTRKALGYIDIHVAGILNVNDKLDILNIAYLLKYADLYFCSSRYIDALKHYKQIINIISFNYLRNGIKKPFIYEMEKHVIDRMACSVKEYKKHEKRIKIAGCIV